LFGDPDPDLRIEAINVLALDDAPANLAFLRQALNDPEERVRNAAGQYLLNK
jgi:HEAT repeat protein